MTQKAQRLNHCVLGGDGGESNRPATNFPAISMDSNRIYCLVDKSGLGVESRRLESATKRGVFRHVGV